MAQRITTDLRFINCAGCQITLEVTAPNNKWCSDCRAKNNRASILNWQKANPDKVKKIKQRWWENNSEKMLEELRSYRKAHPGKAAEWHRNWVRANPEKAKAIQSRRRAVKNNSEATLTASEWYSICEMYDWTCVYCDNYLGQNAVEMDHVLALSRGGAHAVDNVVPACPSCNRSKGAKLVEEWLPGRLIDLGLTE